MTFSTHIISTAMISNSKCYCWCALEKVSNEHAEEYSSYKFLHGLLRIHATYRTSPSLSHDSVRTISNCDMKRGRAAVFDCGGRMATCVGCDLRVARWGREDWFPRFLLAPLLVSLQISQSRTTSRSISIPQRRKKKLLSLPSDGREGNPLHYYSFSCSCRPWSTRAASSRATPPSRSSGKTVSSQMK